MALGAEFVDAPKFSIVPLRTVASSGIRELSSACVRCRSTEHSGSVVSFASGYELVLDAPRSSRGKPLQQNHIDNRSIAINDEKTVLAKKKALDQVTYWSRLVAARARTRT